MKTHFVFPESPPPENLAVYEMCKNVLDLDRPQMTLWRMFLACGTPKATNTHSECVILIAFPLKQWLHRGASILHCTHTACLVRYFSNFFPILCLTSVKSC